MNKRKREVTAGIVTGIIGFGLFILGLYNIQELVQHNQLINLLGIITQVPGGIFFMYVGAKVVDP